MKLTRMISLLLALVMMVSVFGTVAFAAETGTAYEATEEFTVSTDDAQVPYYMGTVYPGDNQYYFLKGGGSTSKIEGYEKTSLPTTVNVWQSTPIYIEKVDAGYRMYYLKETNKSYIAITSGGVTNNQKDQTDAKNTFTWDEENKVFYQMDKVNGEAQPAKYILAITTDTDGSAKTRFTAERWEDYVANSGSKKIYPVQLFTPEAVGVRAPVDVDLTPIAEPEEGKPYFLCVNQNDKGENGTVYYWIGTVVDTAAALFYETATDNGKAAIVFLEKGDTGWRLTQMLGGEKKYVYLNKKGSDMALGLIDETKYATEFRWDDAYNTFVADYFGTDIFMGVNTELNPDGTVKTPYTKIKPLKTTVLGEPHRFSSFLVAVPESVQVEAPPPPETEPETIPPTTEPLVIPQKPEPTASPLQIIGFAAAAVLMVSGIVLLVLDKKKPKAAS